MRIAVSKTMEQSMAVEPLALSGEERSELKALVTRPKTAQALALGRGSCWPARKAPRTSRSRPNCVWMKRRSENTAALCLAQDRWLARRSGESRTIDDARIEAVIVNTLESLPADCRIESAFNMLEDFRRIATRYDRLARATSRPLALQQCSHGGFNETGP